MLCFWCSDVQAGFGDFPCNKICNLVKIFDPDHSSLYAYFPLGKINVTPAQPRQFSHTDSGMHTKEQSEIEVIDVFCKKPLQFVIVLYVHNLDFLIGSCNMRIPDRLTGIDALLRCKAKNTPEHA